MILQAVHFGIAKQWGIAILIKIQLSNYSKETVRLFSSLIRNFNAIQNLQTKICCHEIRYQVTAISHGYLPFCFV